jgi:hypothetical protein
VACTDSGGTVAGRIRGCPIDGRPLATVRGAIGSEKGGFFADLPLQRAGGPRAPAATDVSTVYSPFSSPLAYAPLVLVYEAHYVGQAYAGGKSFDAREASLAAAFTDIRGYQ